MRSYVDIIYYIKYKEAIVINRLKQIDSYVNNYIFDNYYNYDFGYTIKRNENCKIHIQYKDITLNIIITENKIRLGIDSDLTAMLATNMTDIIIFDDSEYLYREIQTKLFSVLDLVFLYNIEELKKNEFIKNNLMEYYDD